MKLNLGAGYEHLGPDWYRIDLDPDTLPDVVADVRTLPKEWDGKVDEIRAVDILEHLSYRDTVPALKEWARVLKPGGRIFIQVPAADLIIDRWDKTRDRGQYSGDYWWQQAQEEFDDKVDGHVPEDATRMVGLAWWLLGGHYDDQYTRSSDRWYLNAHHALFDRETIRWAAEEAGLKVESIDVNPHPNYLVWLVKP
jgi:SAM-dependent methyltransferase